MQPLQSKEIYGNWATLLLPINQDESIDFVRLEEEIDFFVQSKVNGIYSNGTAGEFYNQTENEFDRISELLAAKCEAGNTPFQIGCSHVSPLISLERIKRAVALKPGAIQVILPDWSVPSLDEVIRYLAVLAEAADPVGLVLYNPPHAKKRVTPVELQQIKKAGIPLVGCKVGLPDKEWYAQMKTAFPGLSIFIPGHYLATELSRGAHGAYSNVACLHPAVAQQWYELAMNDKVTALEWEKNIQLFMREYIAPFIKDKGFSNQAADKLLAAVGGWASVGTRLRWPYLGINEKEIAPIRRAAQELLPQFFYSESNSYRKNHDAVS